MITRLISLAFLIGGVSVAAGASSAMFASKFKELTSASTEGSTHGRFLAISTEAYVADLQKTEKRFERLEDRTDKRLERLEDKMDAVLRIMAKDSRN